LEDEVEDEVMAARNSARWRGEYEDLVSAGWTLTLALASALVTALPIEREDRRRSAEAAA